MILKVNSQAPNFILPNAQSKKISLKDFRGKWVVLYFYPKDNTPGCTIEAVDFTKKLKDFKNLNAIVIGVSPDSPKSHAGFIDKQKLSVILLSDEQKDVLQKYAIWGKKKFMGREYMGVLRTTYLIDPHGNIAHVWENVKVKGHADEVLEKVNELQKQD